jgi:hypothetical protein
MTFSAIFMLSLAAACVYLAFNCVRHMLDGKNDTKAIFAVLAVVWGSSAGYLAGKNQGSHETAEFFHAAMMSALPFELYEEVKDTLQWHAELKAGQ